MNAMLKTGALAALTVTLLGGCASYTGQTNDPSIQANEVRIYVR